MSTLRCSCCFCTIGDGTPDVAPDHINVEALLSLLHELCAIKREETTHQDRRQCLGQQFSRLEKIKGLCPFPIFPHTFDAGSLAFLTLACC